ncbi:MAG TPA: trigger factor [Solirubrobacteraceae bacterium]|nr:trigger factor [Solirubrobacteraceae bacterium]
MAGAVQTTVTELPESRVRVDVEVAPEELQRRVESTARELGRSMKLPGFRKGKVPAPLVLQRVGRDAVLDEAVREGLPGWYAGAIEVSRIVPVGDPKIDLAGLPTQGDALQFSIEIGVLPKAKLGEYRGLEVGRAEPAVTEEQVDAEIELVRDRLARLETVQRPAEGEDFVVVDYTARLAPVGRASEAATGQAADAEDAPGGASIPGAEGRDQLVQLSGDLIPGFREGLLGASAGERRTLALTFPEDYSNDQLAGRDTHFDVTVKEVKSKRLPEVDDELAIDAGFDDLVTLREDIAARLTEQERRRADEEFREAALDVAVAQAQVPVTEELIEARAKEMWERMLHTLSHRGISREAYLRIVGRSEAEMLGEIRPEAERALRREAVLTAVVVQEQIEPSDEEVLEALRPSAEREGVQPQKLIDDLRSAGRLEELRESLAARRAIDLIAETATPIAAERARAKEKLWTPGQQGEEAAVAAPARLWTPDR